MNIVEVRDKTTAREFLMLPVRLYKDDPNWIRPLDQDINGVFDPKKNKFFEHGECIRWLLRDTDGKTIGRVAAFINHKAVHKDNDQPTGGMGFFECIKDQEAAFKLFDQCKHWLEEKGMQAMDGPINFGEREQWWGLLVEGFTEPNYCMPYNFLYYKDFFEAYGFQIYFKQFTYQRPVGPEAKLSPAIYRAAKITENNPDYVYRHIEKSELKIAPELFRKVYNQAWVHHAGVEEMTSEQAHNLFMQIKPILDVRLLWFAFYKDEPVGFFISIPELNQVVKYLNGKLDLIGKVKFLYHKWRGTNNKTLGLVFGVVPEHQRKGVQGALLVAYVDKAWKGYMEPFTIQEMNWIGDFNPKMIKVVEHIEGKLSKTHITYRKLFDETKPFKRVPIIS